jgi:pyrimidine operon attenuation protein/uracil phosphoribosyltransferase
MKWCSDCGLEHIDSATSCADCGGALTGQQPPAPPVPVAEVKDHRTEVIDIAHLDDDQRLMLPQLLNGSDIPFDIDGARVVLCDEVIFTGRSIRAALAELLDFGRPACVQLAVLVDRGGREFPIQPDFTAHTIHIAENERITVQFTEVDPVDGVFIESSASH